MVLGIFLLSISIVGIAKPFINPAYATSTNYTLTEWTVLTANSGPVGISLDPSGKCCWFVEFFANNLAHLDPTTGTFQEWPIPTASSQPLGTTTTTFSGQMEVWGTEFAKDKIFVFSPTTSMFREFPLPHANSGAEYISIEPSGTNVRAWFNEVQRNANGEIIYDPSTPNSGTLYEDTFPAAAGGGANGVYAGPGVVWYEGESGIVKWDRVTNQYTVWPLPSHGSAIGDFIALDALGQAWYTQGVQTPSGADNYVGVLRGDNTIKEWQIPTIGADPRLISINPLTQHPWIAEDSVNAGNGKVAELDPSAGGTVVPATPTTSPSGGGPVSVTAAALPATVSTNVVAPTSAPNVGTPNGQFTEWPIGSNTQPHDVVVDSSGNIWVLESGANKVAELTPTSPDFSLSPSPPTISIPQGGSGMVTITGTSQLSFSGPVALSVTGSVPTGVSFSAFNPNPISVPSGGSASASLTIDLASNAPVGTSTITISGTGSSGTHTTSFTLTITSGADFSLSLNSPTLSVGAGGSSTDTVTVTSTGSFNSAVDLSASSLPGGVHVSFSPPSVTPSAGGTITSTATVTVDPGTLALVSTITITGTSGSLVHSQSLALTITITPDFSISANPTSIPIVQGASGTSTITVSSTNGFNSAVDLSYSWIGSAPSGVSVSLPGPVTPTPTTPATSTLTLSASSSSSTGSFTLAVTGTNGALTHSVNLGILITAASTTTTAPGTPKCLIATATYGSELAPEVQLLRNFRDYSIMKTQSGSNFMVAFNAWYYSFSPYVAVYLTNHWVERTIMKGVLYPLIGILYLTSNLFSATSAYPELAALLSGLFASSLIGAFYLGAPLSLLRARFRRLRGLKTQNLVQKLLGISLLSGLTGLLLGEILASPLVLMISSATVVLSTLFLSAALTSAKAAKRLQTRI
jgi:streptogramin lyase